ncbi:MAG: tetratricopeptide repeat protein [Verrucomicrobia bacterium]|nr:tetratricopeptide repeat protein [Verrucomicrobiota bacterium]MCH8526038.1 tetratricopeptide repeat protein [Kiritimatiellia bacterium]
MNYSTFFLIALLAILTGCGRSPDRLARRGLALLDAGKPAEAAELLERALVNREEDSETAALWGALGLARGRAGRLALAEDAFRTASGLADEDFWIHINYGGLLIQQGRFADALEPLAVAVRADLYRTEALELMADAALRLEDKDLALRMLEEASIRANDPRVMTSLATLAANDSESRLKLQEALDLDPAYGPAALNLAVLIDRSGSEIHRALHYYERYMSITPREEIDPAVRDRVDVLKRRRDNPDGVEDATVVQIREFLSRSREAVREGNRMTALNYATRAAQLAQRGGRTDLEEQALRQGVSAAPDQGRAHAALGQFYLTQERNEDAVRSFREAARLAPDALPAQMGLARAALAARQNTLAREALERAEGLATSGAVLDEIAGIYRDDLRDRRSVRRVERLRAERFPE